MAIKILVKTGHRFVQEYQLGSFWYDFSIPAFRLLIEVDSHTYHSHPSRRRRDRAKAEIASEQGWKVARVTRDDMEGQINSAILKRQIELDVATTQ